MELTKRQILEMYKKLDNKKLLSEEEKGILGIENILLIAGFVPIIGEIADIALICYYLYRGEKLYAALMLIALIPTVGDFVAKPIIRAFKTNPSILKSSANLGEYLAKNPKIAEKFQNIAKYANDSRVTQTISGITNINKGWGSRLKEGIGSLIKSVGPVGKSLKAGGQSLAAGKSFSSGLKGYFQGQRLSKYFAKYGTLPSTAIGRWWQNILARRDRRFAFSKFLIANNLLGTLGIPNIQSIEQWMESDENKQKLADNPITSDYIAQNSTESDFRGQDQEGNQESGGGLMGGIMGIGVLKMLARLYT